MSKIVVVDRDDLRELVTEACAQAVSSIVSHHELPEWINLQRACALKGIAYNSAKSKPRLQPNGGVADATLNGRRVWSKETVFKWLSVTDE